MNIFCKNCGWLADNDIRITGMHIDLSGIEPVAHYDYRCKLCGMPVWEDDVEDDEERDGTR